MIKKPFRIRIRKARKEDLNLLVALNREFANYHARIDPKFWRPTDKEYEEEFRRYTRKELKRINVRTLLAYVDGTPAGYFLGELDEAKLEGTDLAFVYKRYGYISAAYVRKEFRHTGVGRAMFDDLVRWFRRRGVKHIELKIDTRNRLGIRAWKRLGFREFMRIMELTL